MRGSTGIRTPSRLGGRRWRVVTGAAILVAGGAVAAPLSYAAAKPAPELSFTPASYNISLPSGEYVDRDITLANSGSTPARGLRLTLDPRRDTGFSIASEECPVKLGSGESCTMTIKFAPGTPLIADVVLKATSARASAELPMTGTGRDDTLPAACQEGKMCIIGTEGPDYIGGTEDADYIEGLGGDDELHGKLMNDVIYGGPGNDLIYGGWNRDELFGGDHNDTIQGKEHDDLLYGGHGTDHLYGDNGDDVLEAGLSRYVAGSPLADGFPDYLDGGGGNDTCYVAEAIDITVNCEVVLPSTGTMWGKDM